MRSIEIRHSQHIPEQNLDKSKLDFLIRPLLPEIDKRKLNEQPHRHRFHEIIYLKSGSGQHYIDDKLIKLRHRTFYFITQNHVHGFDYGTQLEGYLIRFNDNFLPVMNDSFDVLRNYEHTAAQKNTLQLTVADAADLESQLYMIHQTFEKINTGRIVTIQHMLLALLNELIIKIKDEFRNEINAISDKDHKTFNKFIYLLNENFILQHSLAFYAQKLGISKRKLSEISQRYYGEPAKSILLKRLVDESKRYLRYTSLSVKEIAYKLNFDDPAYLSRLFKNYTKSSMTAYRNLKV